jgi:uncharacterized protein (TIGR02246 family)
VNKEKDKGSPKPAVSTEPRDAETTVPQVGPYNKALGEIYQRLYPEIRRPKPNQEAIAAALQAMQRLTMEADAETATENAVELTRGIGAVCAVCGHRNREGNRFCGACGISLESASASASDLSVQESLTSAPSSPSTESDEVERQAPLPQEVFSDPNQIPAEPREAETMPGAAGAARGVHYYHHHYHHHYFQSSGEALPVPRAGAEDSAREADRLRVAAAAKGEHMSRNEAAVRRLTQEWILACNTRHLDELIELYAADALVLRSNLPPMRGAAAVREFFFASLEAGLGEVALEPMRVEVSGDIAHEVGRYSALVPGTTGKRREERGKYLWVFARQAGGEWKLTAECWCSDLTLISAESDIPKPTVAIASKTPVRKN